MRQRQKRRLYNVLDNSGGRKSYIGPAIAIFLLVVIVALAIILPLVLIKSPSFKTTVLSPDNIKGLCNEVTIIRDTFGEATILAKSDNDVYVAFGYSLADEMLFNLDLERRQGNYTLSELLGSSQLGRDDNIIFDPYPPTLEQWSGNTENMLHWDAMAKGINAFIASHPLPPEYAKLGFTSKSQVTPFEALDFGRIINARTFQPLGVRLTDFFNDLMRNLVLGAGKTPAEASRFALDDARSASIIEPEFHTGSATFLADLADCSTGTSKRRRIRTRRKNQHEKTSHMMDTFYQHIDESLMNELHVKMEEYGKNFTDVVTKIDGSITGSNWVIVHGNHTRSKKTMIAGQSDRSHTRGGRGNVAFRRVVVENDCNYGPMSAIFSVKFAALFMENDFISTTLTVGNIDVEDVFLEIINFDASGEPISTDFLRDNTTFAIKRMDHEFFVNDLSGNIVSGGIQTFYKIPEKNNAGLFIIIPPSSFPGKGVGLAHMIRKAPRAVVPDISRVLRSKTAAEYLKFIQSDNMAAMFNIGVADTDGNIGFTSTVRLTVLEDIEQGFVDEVGPWFVRDGTGTMQHQWLPRTTIDPYFGDDGFMYQRGLPHETPHSINPAKGYLINANANLSPDCPDSAFDAHTGYNCFKPNGGMFYVSLVDTTAFRQQEVHLKLLERIAATGDKLELEDVRKATSSIRSGSLLVIRDFLVAAFDNGIASGADSTLAALATSDSRFPQVMDTYLRGWNGESPTGIKEGFDPGDDPFNLPEPTEVEKLRSVATTILSVVANRYTTTFIELARIAAGITGGSFFTFSTSTKMLQQFPTRNGILNSGFDLFAGQPGTTQRDRLDITLLTALVDAFALLQDGSPGKFPTFGGSTNPADWLWGKIHLYVFNAPFSGHQLGQLGITTDFDIPPKGNNSLVFTSSVGSGFPRSGAFNSPQSGTPLSRTGDSESSYHSTISANFRILAQMSCNENQAISKRVHRSGIFVNPDSPHYADQLPLWLTNRYIDVSKPKDLLSPTFKKESKQILKPINDACIDQTVCFCAERPDNACPMCPSRQVDVDKISKFS